MGVAESVKLMLSKPFKIRSCKREQPLRPIVKENAHTGTTMRSRSRRSKCCTHSQVRYNQKRAISRPPRKESVKKLDQRSSPPRPKKVQLDKGLHAHSNLKECPWSDFSQSTGPGNKNSRRRTPYRWKFVRTGKTMIIWHTHAYINIHTYHFVDRVLPTIFFYTQRWHLSARRNRFF